jgi:hypothetical protein
MNYLDFRAGSLRRSERAGQSAASCSRTGGAYSLRRFSLLSLVACTRLVSLIAVLSFVAVMPKLFAAVTGSISGTAHDAQGAVLPGVTVTLTNTQTGVVHTTLTDSVGFYNFSVIPVGSYNVDFERTGFKNFQQTGITINVDTAARIDADLTVGATQEQVTVQSTQVEVNTVNPQMGEVIDGKEMNNMPLNGRAYTDLLALQPGVNPISVAQFGSEAPANSLNNGLLSISGARDSNSGFMVNGANVVEGYAGGTFLVPTLDSIAEFRIITSNAGAEYGNYSGGLVNVVTKSGTNKLHGDAFEFFRNTNLDGRNFFDPTRGVFKQNQFGGTVGGPIRRDKIFFFADYQGTRQTIGVSTGLVLVPSAADVTGDLSDQTASLTGSVNGTYWANALAARLGYPVTAGESYYKPGCTSSTVCVFPNAKIPQSAWSSVSPNVLKLLPAANAGQYFTTSANSETLTEDKGSVRVDGNTRIGLLSGYYHWDPWNNPSPYSGFGGSSVPGFPNITTGKAQLIIFSDTTTFKNNMVNVFNASYTRNKNISGLSSGTGPSLSSLGFASPQNEGIYQLSTQYQNWPVMSFNNYTLGAPESIVSQFNNTYQGQDDFSLVFRSHTLKFGGDYHWDQVDISHPNNASNGGFGFSGAETGYDFADMLIGAPDYFFQGTAAGLNLRSFYLGIYAEDSWRASPNLTLSYGLRYEVTPYWADEHNRSPVVLFGKQSTEFPTAPAGFLFPGQDGVPHHLAFIRWNNFAPRLGVAYSPDVQDGFLHRVFGNHGDSSLRVGWGIYYTNIQGANTFNFAAPPYSLFYSSSAPPLFSQPFITRASGQNLGQRFPLPPVDPNNVNWAAYEPLNGDVNPPLHNPTPSSIHTDVSFQRAVARNTLWTVSYVGTFGRHLLLNADQNQGNQALCLGLSQTSQVLAGTPTCAPFGENGVYYPAAGGTVNGTREPFGPEFGGEGLTLDVGSSAYNALETSLRHSSERLALLVSYTYSKALDDGSSFGDQIVLGMPSDFYRGLSSFDLRHNFVASYTYELPFDYLFRSDNRLTRGWKISGIADFTTGVPVQISESDDRSLLGSTGNSPVAGSPDEPELAPGNLGGNHNPRHLQPYFNTSLFSQEALGAIGNSPRRFFSGPGLDNWDLALLKDVKVTEGTSAEFRAEFFNAFNHTQFYGISSVDGNFNDGPGAFGHVTEAANARIGQLAVKFNF